MTLCERNGLQHAGELYVARYNPGGAGRSQRTRYLSRHSECGT